MRRKISKKIEIKPDSVYESVKISKLINYMTKSGKKNAARKVVNEAFSVLKEKAKTESPLEVFESALKNTGPTVEVRSRRVGGANYQIPREVRPERRQYLAMKWIIDAAKTKTGTPMHIRLADEILSASKNEGEAVKKRENTHKMAEANKAFAHFTW